VVNPPAATSRLKNGRLSDIAPTLLDIIGLPKPAAMTGHSLMVLAAGQHAAD
jgi:2,3-bisphosphoglycerate-independent phosphoglycerate mutase